MEISSGLNQMEGLTQQQVEESRARYGANRLSPPQRPRLWRLYLEKFQDPVIRILLVAALLSFVVSFIENDFAETVGIVCAVFLATGVGFYFEYDAIRKFDCLNAMESDTAARVWRAGGAVEIPRSEVVVGDVLLLEAGDEVPADATLLQADSLRVNESCLTGEPMVKKSVNPADFDDEATYATNRILRGTTLMEGDARARVTAVGDATEIGKVTHEATVVTGSKTPLNQQLDRLASLINKVGYTVSVLAFLVFSIREWIEFQSGSPVWDAHAYIWVAKMLLGNFMMAVSLIVMAVPEGLPMAITLSLALNMRRMLKTNNLVRKMHAGETMGAVTVICTDKTGTLTQNNMTVSELKMTDTRMDVMAEALACNTTAFLDSSRSSGLGNPTEVSLLLWLQKQGADYDLLRREIPVKQRLPFSSERKYMATVVHSKVLNEDVVFVKGAPELLLNHCALEEHTRAELTTALVQWQNRALRTLAVAYGNMPEGEDCDTAFRKGGLTLLGMMAISDPVRREVPLAVSECLKAGVSVKMVTGDSTATAIEVARQVGLWTEGDCEDKNCMRGADFAVLDDEEALQRICSLKIMSRARPLDKQRLVKLLQQQGEVVAVTGDGTNDAPALNYAQVGVSMGSGTSAAREASDITLLDDSFRSIVTAIMWGRSLYRNIQRFILFQLTVNFTALLTVLVGAFIGADLPLTVTQILWVNIIMDTFAALALASLPADPTVMRDRPRALSRFIITPSIWRTVFVYGSLFVSVLLLLLAYYGRDGRIAVHELTVFFTVFVMLQFWNLFNAKAFATSRSAFHDLRGCRGLWLGVSLIGMGQWVIVHFGGTAFRTVPLSAMEWGIITLSTSVVLWMGEAQRWFVRSVNKGSADEGTH